MGIVCLKKIRITFMDELFKKGSIPGYEESEPKYSAQFIYKPGSEHEKIIDDEVDTVIKARAGEKWEKEKRAYAKNNSIYCSMDGDDKDYEGYKGMKYIIAKSKRPVIVKDAYKNPITEDNNPITSGDYVNLWGNIYANKGGVGFALMAVQLVKKGPFLGGATIKEDAFEDCSAEFEADDDNEVDSSLF